MQQRSKEKEYTRNSLFLVQAREFVGQNNWKNSWVCFSGFLVQTQIAMKQQATMTAITGKF
jgi:hypothetical protein